MSIGKIDASKRTTWDIRTLNNPEQSAFLFVLRFEDDAFEFPREQRFPDENCGTRRKMRVLNKDGECHEVGDPLELIRNERHHSRHSARTTG